MTSFEQPRSPLGSNAVVAGYAPLDDGPTLSPIVTSPTSHSGWLRKKGSISATAVFGVVQGRH